MREETRFEKRPRNVRNTRFGADENLNYPAAVTRGYGQLHVEFSFH